MDVQMTLARPAIPGGLPSELLCEAFAYLQRKRDMYHAALVCSAWCGAALDRLWGEIYDLTPLLNLLDTTGDLEADASHGFTGDLTQTNREIFDSYAGRIHSVHVTEDYKKLTAAFSTYSSTTLGPRRLLFPNLRHIDLASYGECGACLPYFLVPTVETIVFPLYLFDNIGWLRITRSPIAAACVLRCIASARLPRLRGFNCHISNDSASFSQALVNCLRSHPTITSFAYVGKPMRTTILVALQALPSITSISIRYITEPGAMYLYLAQLASACPLLQSIDIRRFNPHTDWLDVLQPIIHLPLLELELSCDQPMVLHQSDVHRLATMWPNLRRLELCSVSPTIPRASNDRGTPPDILTSFPTAFLSSIRHLALDINFKRPIPVPVMGQGFQGLQYFDAGGWRVPNSNIASVGKLLGHICPCGVFPTIPEASSYDWGSRPDIAANWERMTKGWRRVFGVMEEIHRRRSHPKIE